MRRSSGRAEASLLRVGQSHAYREKVAELVGEGLTNPQIAERMFIARGTVKVHLGHIFTKLTVSTRSELAAEVARRTAAVPSKI